MNKESDIDGTGDSDHRLSSKEQNIYRYMLGGLSYLATCTSPDIAFAISCLARRLQDPCERNRQTAKRLMRYISGTLQLGLFFRAEIPQHASSLRGSVDADWAGEKEARRSTSGYVISVNHTPIYWRSKRQTMIAMYSGESEYIDLSSCAKGLSWLRQMFWEICHAAPAPEEPCIAPTVI